MWLNYIPPNMGLTYTTNARTNNLMSPSIALYDTFSWLVCLKENLLNVRWWACASGCVVECRIWYLEFAGSNLGLGYVAPRSICYYSAFHPYGLGKWVPAVAGKAKAGMAYSDCGWNAGCAGKTVLSLDNVCYTWAPWRCFMWRHYTKWLPLPLPFTRTTQKLCLYLSPYNVSIDVVLYRLYSTVHSLGVYQSTMYYTISLSWRQSKLPFVCPAGYQIKSILQSCCVISTSYLQINFNMNNLTIPWLLSNASNLYI